MKKITFLAFLALGNFCFSQTTVEKYNSFYKRYEYFDSSGSLIGYKKYNSLSGQWEYYDMSKTQYQKQPRKYGEYIAPYDLKSLENTLSTKRNQYNSNYQLIYSKAKDIEADFSYVFRSRNRPDIKEDLKYLLNEFNVFTEGIAEIMKGDFSDNSYTLKAYDWLKQFEHLKKYR